MADYPHVINEKKYSQKGLILQEKIPRNWICGKCKKLNPKGKEYCMYCDHKYQLEYMITDENQGEDSHAGYMKITTPESKNENDIELNIDICDNKESHNPEL